MQSKNKRIGLDPIEFGSLSKKAFKDKFLKLIGNLAECEEMHAKCVKAYKASKKKTKTTESPE